jgi:hypothetical protein
MTRARDNANNWAADITGVTAGTGITGGGTSGTVTVTNEMVTTIDAKGDLVVGSGADAFVRVPVGTNNQVLTADSATTSGVKWATGNSGKYLTTNGTTASWGTLNQATVWTNRKGPTADAIYSIASNGSNIYVAVGNNGTLFSSSDGTTWTSRTSGFGSDAILDVAYGNGLFVAVGSNGKMSTSTDGTTWTTRTANMATNPINKVAYLNSLWIAVGGGMLSDGGITTSTDGTTWTRRTVPSTVGDNARYVTYGNGYYVVGTDYNSSNILYSANGTTGWTAGTSATTNEIQFVYWGGTHWIAINGNSGNYQISSTTPPSSGWSNIYNYSFSSDSRNYIRQANIYNNMIYFNHGGGNAPGPLQINGVSTGVTSNRPTSFATPILLPTILGSATYGNILTFYALLIRSDGSIIVGDTEGRIYTSF